ncbi:MAG: hypothetical protein ACC619_10700 [Paracoccaceae bacterium]
MSRVVLDWCERNDKAAVMKLRWLHILAMLAAGGAAAQEWQPMSGAEIGEMLTDNRLTYDGAVQDFYASGRTLYNAGRDSWGSWQVRAGQYCSLWPPVDRWDCYDMTRAGDAVQFIDARGNITEGRLAE